MPIKGMAVAGLAVGGVMLYAGFKGKSIPSTARYLIGGQDPSAATPANQIQGTALSPTSGGGGPFPKPTAHGGSAALNQAKAKAMCIPFGWSTGNEWAALVALWNQESGWNQYATNPTSGAYGIPQALPASKMGRLANPPFSLASAQIAWGLRYIRQRYGDPIAAWHHEQANNWY
jgi:resuscitation-promoting factor RpfB